METRSFERAEHLLEAIDDSQPDVLITDVRMPGMSGLALLERLRSTCPDLPVIVITAHSDLENAVAAYKGGAFEYLPKPFDIDEAVGLVHKAARSTGAVPADDSKPEPIASMIGQAPAMQEVFRSIGRLAGSSMTVLITGESWPPILRLTGTSLKYVPTLLSAPGLKAPVPTPRMVYMVWPRRPARRGFLHDGAIWRPCFRLPRRHSRESGSPCGAVDSRFRGNDGHWLGGS